MGPGGRVEVTVLLPGFAELEPNETRGVDLNGNEISEISYELHNVNR